MKVFRTAAEIRQALEPAEREPIVGFVPTMGAFHEGHVALFRAAKRECDVVVASVFVNPSQFNDPADFAAYPRDRSADERVAAASGVDLLFVPSVDDMYPAGHATWVDVEGPARGFESDFRPGHFRGVATICVKLFSIVRPDVVFLGQKDAQQVAVIKQIVRDLNLGLAIRVIPTVRAADGLALSSRNQRLSADDRRRALAIPRALAAGQAAYQEGGDVVAAARADLADLAIDYVAVADFEGQPTLTIAARVGATRLIDNVPLGASRELHERPAGDRAASSKGVGS